MADIQHWPNWAMTALGTPIELFAAPHFKWSTNQQPILLFGGVHGDEPEGVALAESTLNWLRQAHAEANGQICPWLLIPCLNVDGYQAGTRVNGRGVDLNRNYPAQNWTPQSEQNRYWPGPFAGSEPETQVIASLIEKERPRLVIHCHSWEPCVVYTGQPGSTDAKRLAKASGYPEQDHIGYPTPGSLSHFGWHDHQIPVICIEAQEHSQLDTVWPRFKEGIQAIFKDTSLRSR